MFALLYFVHYHVLFVTLAQVHLSICIISVLSRQAAYHCPPPYRQFQSGVFRKQLAAGTSHEIIRLGIEKLWGTLMMPTSRKFGYIEEDH